MLFYAAICSIVFISKKDKKMKRERYVDIVKGLSILCITLLHYENGIFPSYLNVFVGSFMITAFYVSVGWVSAMSPSQRSLKGLIQKRWKQLGIPYLWWSAIILVFDLILWSFGYYDAYFIEREIYKTVSLRGIGTLWFLPALFGGEIIWYWLKKQNKAGLIVGALVFSLCYQYFYHQLFDGGLESLYRIIDAPFRTINNMLGAWIGIAFGSYAYGFLKNRFFQISKCQLFVVGSCLCCSAFITSNYLPTVLSPFWGLLAPLFGPLGLLLLAKSVQQFKWLDYFNYWGINSLNLMVTHYSVILVLFIIGVENGLKQPFYGWITIICFIISMPIQYGLVKMVNRYAKFTLGK